MSFFAAWRLINEEHYLGLKQAFSKVWTNANCLSKGNRFLFVH